MATAVLAGASVQEVRDISPAGYVLWHRGLEALRQSMAVPRPVGREVRCHWIYGRSGVGKSWKIWDLARSESQQRGWRIYSKTPGKWWGGYCGEEILVINELRQGEIDTGAILRILDRYPVSIEPKGGEVPLSAQSVYISSLEHPTEIYPHLPEAGRELLRRINTLEFMTSTYFNFETYEWK